MHAKSSIGLLFLGLAAAVGVACSSPAPDDGARGASAKVTQGAFDKNAVLDDVSLRDVDAMTAEDVQAFLDETPWGTRSALATYEVEGKTAAQIIHATAVKHGINPLELLVRLQMEQGLIRKTTATDATIDVAFGCGCPHSPVCSDKYMGFENQAECAAGTLSRSMDRAVTSTGTVSGWARSRAKQTEDGVTVTPKNAATAALYTYTPWVGEAGGGREGVGGASLHFSVWDRFATAVGYGAWATPTETPRTSETDAGAPSSDTDAAAPGDPGEGEEETADASAPPASDAGTRGDAAPKDEGAPPSDGSDDGEILGEGSAPPASNGAPPKSSSPGRRGPEELPEATEEELAGKPKSTGGCSTTGSNGHGDAAAIALATAAVIVAARRRRGATS